VVKLLLDHGAEINARDQESSATPLSYAASLGRTEVVELLLARGADPTLKNIRGQSPLDIAVENNQQEVSALLRRPLAK
jgi:ankyrin repeat protein